LKNLVRRCWLFIVCVIDLINQSIFHSQACIQWCFREIKWVLFSVEGMCRHSGNCCKFIHISYNAKPIKSLTSFKSIVKKNSIMSRFKPNLLGKTIQYFDCSCLTKDNLCSHYDTKPQFCSQYPYSILYSDATLHHDCGYFLTQRFGLPFFSSSVLKKTVIIFKYNNGFTDYQVSI